MQKKNIYIYIYTHKILHEKHSQVYQKVSHGVQFSLNLNKEIILFPCKTVNIGTIIIILISEYQNLQTFLSIILCALLWL